MVWTRSHLAAILFLVGALLVVTGVVGRYVIFPMVERMPANHEHTIGFEGTADRMDEKTRQVIHTDVKATRIQKAIGHFDNVLMIQEVMFFQDAKTGAYLPEMNQYRELAVQRYTRNMVPEYGDMSRTGCFSFPAYISKKSYYMGNYDLIGQPLEMKFVEEKRYEGLRVFVFETHAQDVPITNPPAALPAGMEATFSIDAIFWVEPVSGATVHEENVASIKVSVPRMGDIEAERVALKFDKQTEEHYLNVGRHNKARLIWYRRYLTFSGIFAGLALWAGGLTSHFWRRDLPEDI